MLNNFSVIHKLTRKETVQTIDSLIQNLISYKKTFPNQTYLLVDSFENKEVLAAAKTIQMHFPNLIFSKVAKNTSIEGLIQEFELQDLLVITNDNLLTQQELQYIKIEVPQKINRNQSQIFLHKDVAIRAEKSIFKKVLLYFRYES